MAILELAASRRKDIGKESNRRRAHAGKVPGVIYGKGVESRAIEFDRKTLETFLSAARKGTVVAKMAIVGDDATKGEVFAILKETQSAPLAGNVIHADFYQLAPGQTFKVVVPVRTKGKAPGAEFGGILEQPTRSLHVWCTAESIPGSIEIDVSSLNLGQSIHLAEIVFPVGVTHAEKDPHMTIVAVHAPKEEKAATPAEGEVASVAEAAPAAGAKKA